MSAIIGSTNTDASGNQYKVVLSDDFSAGYKYANWGSPYHGGTYGNGAFWWNANDTKVASGEMQVSVTRQANGSFEDLNYKGATFAKETFSFKINGPADFYFHEAAEGFGATYIGTSSGDTFAVDHGEGHVVIDRFTSGADKLQFRGLARSDMHMATTTEGGIPGLSVRFDNASDTVFLAHVSKLADTDMIFA